MKKEMTASSIYIHSVYRVGKFYVNGRKSILESIRYSLFLLPYLIRGAYDIIDCEQFPYFSIFVSKMCSVLKEVPLICTCHEVWGKYWKEYMDSRLFALIGRLIERLSLRLADAIVVVSKRGKKDLIELGLDPRKIFYVPNGCNFERINEVETSPFESDVIYAGRLMPHKHLDIVIGAIDIVRATFPDVRCVIIGDGPERRRLEKKVSSLGLEKNVVFTGFMEEHSDVISYMKASKVFVLASTREGFSLAVLEANACGLPVITIEHEKNDARDLINEGKNGFRGELSESFISNKIIDLLSNDDLRSRMSIFSKEHSKRFSWDHTVERVLRIYVETLEGEELKE